MNEGFNASQHLTRKRHVRLGCTSTVPVAESDVHRHDICKSVGTGSVDEIRMLQRSKCVCGLAQERIPKPEPFWDRVKRYLRDLPKYARFERDNPSIGIVVSDPGQLRPHRNNCDKWCTDQDGMTHSETVAARSLRNSATCRYNQAKSLHRIQPAI